MIAKAAGVGTTAVWRLADADVVETRSRTAEAVLAVSAA
jgi:hypothetical protein